MNLLTPQSNCENAAQTAPRIGLRTAGQHQSFLAAPPANVLGDTRQNRKWERFGTVTSKQRIDANGDHRLPSSAGPSRLKYFPQDNPLGFQRS
jgi:hypothetical protein